MAGKGDKPRNCFSKKFRDTSLSIFGAKCARCGQKIEKPTKKNKGGNDLFFCDRNTSCGIFE